MISQRPVSGGYPVRLSLAAGQRIVTSGLDPVLGWIGAERASPAQPLFFPVSLLEPQATSNIVYTCNLPAHYGRSAGNLAPAENLAGIEKAVERGIEAEFLAASLPGGQVAMVSPEGVGMTVRFRWVCLTADASLGAVWRLFARMPSDGLWRTIAHDYVLEAGSGVLLNPPGNLEIPAAAGQEVTLTHPASMLTCLPCHSGRVKVTLLLANGWMKRNLTGLFLYADRSIGARFSDGAEEKFAAAAPGLAALAIAA